jgi:hypothetical protein
VRGPSHGTLPANAVINLPQPLRRRLSRRLVRAARDGAGADALSLGALIAGLGDRSFGWCLVLFSLVSMLPMPVGSNMVTALPILLVTAQMALGLERVWLPGAITRRRIDRRRFGKLVLWLGPVIRPVERVVRPRHLWLFAPPAERFFGAFLFLVAVALFAPVPFSGYLPATALLLAGTGLVERDGLVALLGGVVLGAAGIAVTVVVAGMIFAGAEALAN